MSKGLKKFLIVSLSMLALVIISGTIAIYALSGGVSLESAKLKPTQNSINVYDSENRYIENANDYVTIDEISPMLIDAYVALEDKRFYDHNGLDYKRIAKAMITNIKSGGFSEGGSTITQQLIKNTHLSSEKKIRRKLQEASLAKQLEKNYTKDQILEMYLNIVYLGNGLTGVKDGAYCYFGKNCMELTLKECAVIAGITKNPSRYSPINNLDANLKRARVVLELMLEQKKITQEEFDRAVSEPVDILNLKFTKNKINRSYINSTYLEASLLLNRDVSEIKQSGYRIYTYYDAEKQNAVYQSATARDFQIQTNLGAEANKLCMLADNQTAGVSAYYSDIYLPVQNFKRQPGSVIKPIFSYATALEQNLITEITRVADEPTDFNGYRPGNYADQYMGNITIRTALAQSSNIAAVKLSDICGVDQCVTTAQKLGLQLCAKDKNLSSALGGLTYGVTPTELVTAYCALANYGQTRPVAFIREIRDANGKLVYRRDTPNVRALSEENAYLLTDMLKYTATDGTAKKLKGLNYEVASKTGTVSHSDENYNTDAWNVSYTTKDTLLVWYGTENTEQQGYLTKSITGGSYPVLLSKSVFQNIYRGVQPARFQIPRGISVMDVNKDALQNQGKIVRANPGDHPVNKEQICFHKENIPAELYSRENIPRLQSWNVHIPDRDRVVIEFEAEKNVGYIIKKESVFGSTQQLYDIALMPVSQYIYLEELRSSLDPLTKIVIVPYQIIQGKLIEGVPVKSKMMMYYEKLF